MLDPWVRRRIDKPLNAAGRWLYGRGVRADRITVLGFGCGLAAAAAVALGAFGWALLLFFLNRLADGLDGAVARAAGPTDRGGFLDIVLDFLVYAALPLGFAAADPASNALPAAVLLFTFIGTATSFLAYAVFAAKRGLSTRLRGHKSIYYLGGLTEGTETVAVFALMLLLPAWFPWLAYGFAAACAITAATRIYAGSVTFTAPPPHGG
ncbi:MAG: CDP-alcohol phosphatidyltransferase family protein [Geminicoccaceae bacterium]|nr:MAG: CDP-alcohol phosphatidyltransferase family protein [Geminicoccaceae bacterium]